jgi:pimeloyl-ACP methyl ester carboxylesterase
MKYTITTLILFVILASPSFAQQKPHLAGSWKGYMSVHGAPLVMKMNFKKVKNGYTGTFYVAKFSWPIQEIAVTPKDSVSWKVILKTNGTMYFNGVFRNDSTIKGIFSQNGYQFPFKLSRYTPNITQQKPRPYHHKDVVIRNDTIKIGGTLTWPKKQKTNQLVIIIQGRGYKDRNGRELGGGLNRFGPMAGYLARHGIAVYRYDERGVGESAGNRDLATLGMIASDVKAIVAHFSADSSQHFKNITLYGDGWGGIVAGKVAAQDTLVDQLVLVSSPAVKLYKMLNYYSKAQFKQFNMQQPYINKTIRAMDEVLRAARDSENVEKTKKHFHKLYTQMYAKMIKTVPDSIKNSQRMKMVKALDHGILLDHLKPATLSIDFYNPANDLKRLHIPVLALFRGSFGKNRTAMAAALDSAGVSYQINAFKNAPRFFISQKARAMKNRRIKDVHYHRKIKNPFVKGFLPTIAHWLKRTEPNKQ